MNKIATITIPKELARSGELVLMPRKAYEDYLAYRLRNVKTVKMTRAEEKILERARQNFAKGNYLTLDEFRRKLGIKN